MTDLMKNFLAFLAFAVAAAILNAIFFPGPLEGSFAEGIGKALACWGIAYLITWFVRRRRIAWLFVVSTVVLILVIFV